MPAIGASTTGGDTTNGPMRSTVALAGAVVVEAGVTPTLSQGQHHTDESGASTRAVQPRETRMTRSSPGPGEARPSRLDVVIQSDPSEARLTCRSRPNRPAKCLRLRPASGPRSS